MTPLISKAGMTRIRTERQERGWTRLKMAQKLRDAADPRDVPKSLDSLVHNIVRWEHGHNMSERYRILYCRVFNRGERELFGCNQPSSETATAIPALTSAMDHPDYDGIITVRLPRGIQQISIEVFVSSENQSGENTQPVRQLKMARTTGGQNVK